MGGSPQDTNAVDSANAQAGAQAKTPASEICIPCQASYRVEAHYDDPWKTPLSLAPLRVEYRNGDVIDAGAETLGLRSLGLQDGQLTDDATRTDLGSFEGRAPYAGSIVARIEPQAVADPVALEAEIIRDIAAFGSEMETAMRPWITEWENTGWLGLLSSAWDNLKAGTSAWLDGEGEFWSSVGTWLSNLPEMLGEAWDSVSDSAKALWENRDQIFQLIQQLAEGAVADFERGIAALSEVIKSIPGLEEIGGILEDLVEKSGDWAAAMIELATRTNVLKALGGAIMATMMMIPPNFFSDMVAKGVGYLIPEAIIAILFAILAFFTGGGTAPALYARLTAFVLRVTTALGRAGKAGQALLKVFSLLRTIATKVIDLIKALKAKISEVVESATDAVAKITRRIRRHDVPCFDLPQGANGPEFDRQLAEQMRTINDMTVDDMSYAHLVLDQARIEHERLKALGQRPAGSSFTDLIRNNGAQRTARNTYRQTLVDQGLSPAEIRSAMDSVNATHFLDIVAGGDPDIVGIGGGPENQGIGRQWPKDGRAQGIGTNARNARGRGLSDHKMNVNLRRCR